MSTIYNEGKIPVIGITTWRRDLPTFLGERTDLYTLDPEYSNYVKWAGGLPILLPHSVEQVEAYLDLVDGLVVSGGGDIAPTSYGEEDLGLSYDVNVDTDHFEIELIRKAAEKRVPTLGICRGFQMMQAAFSGKLLQDLHDTYPDHPKNEGKPEYILNQRHAVAFTEDSLLAKVYGTTRREVNTIHHQCVHTIGAGFKPIGWSEDGIIEAVESTTEWFAVGVQWHPEKLKDHSEHELFRYFIQHVRQKREKEAAR